MKKYEEQLGRVRRCYARLEKHYEGFTSSLPIRYPPDYLDDAYSFFQNCYHLKDWLKNDPSFIQKSNSEIEEFINDTPSLAICADICNGTKHLLLSSKPRSGAVPEVGKVTLTVVLPEDYWSHPFGQEPTEGFRIKTTIGILHDGNVIDALTLASEAMQAWEGFVK